MSPRRFTEEVETYTVLRLTLADYKPSGRELPDQFRFCPAVTDAVRVQERALLQQSFDDWQIPFRRELPGWRVDSPLFVVNGDQLVGGVYVCDMNEFDRDSTRGQLHYAFMDLHARGQGIYSVVFREAVRRAQVWGLSELYLNSDRYMLPEVYLRWGARPWKVIAKPSRLPHGRLGNGLRVFYNPLRRLWRLWRRVWLEHGGRGE